MKIVTLTLSPAIDIEYRLNQFNPGGLNRTDSHSVSAGGKGINVSRAILRCAARFAGRDPEKRSFELKTVAPVGGETGEMLRRILESEGIALTAVPVAENTRVNVSVIPDEGKSVEINAPGTPVGDALDGIEAAVLDGIGPGDCVVIAGSCPKDVKKSYPSELVGKVKETGATAVLDCDGEALRIAVNAPVKPDLIKPNNEELAALTGCDPDDRNSLVKAAESLGIGTVVTTLAGDGSILTSRGKSAFFPTVKRPVLRLKGAGDTFLGAFVYARFVRQDSPEDAMVFASKVAGDYVAGE